MENTQNEIFTVENACSISRKPNGGHKLANDEQITIFLFVFDLKSALCIFGVYAKQQIKPENVSIFTKLYQNQELFQSLFYT